MMLREWYEEAFLCKAITSLVKNHVAELLIGDADHCESARLNSSCSRWRTGRAAAKVLQSNHAASSDASVGDGDRTTSRQGISLRGSGTGAGTCWAGRPLWA